MPDPHLHLAPHVPDLEALGVECAADLLTEPAPGSCLARGRALPSPADETRWAYPLPGTPDGSGRVRERPRGAGTGTVCLRRFERAPLLESCLARTTRPRSASLASREWNLVCRARAHGVATPELMALVEGGEGPFAPRSAIVTRGLEGTRPLDRWLAAARGDERRRGLLALGLTLAGLLRAGLWLPRLRAEAVHLAPPAPPPPIESSGAPRARRLPTVLLCDLRGGRVRERASGRRSGELLARLAGPLGVSELEDREVLRVALRAAAAFPRDGQRAFLAGLGLRVSPRVARARGRPRPPTTPAPAA